jgi:HrpA-like RNA helicase
MNTLYPVTIIQRPNENILDIVKQIISKRQRQEQILCFVSSISEVNRYCKLLKELSQNTIIAYPLIQSQSPREQEESIEKGSVFFSTTVAETSLTFSSLKYVVDTGMINVPIYDIHSKRTILTEEHAAKSTIKQRLGRLGRTQSGEYYALYDSNLTRKPFPIPQICQSDLTTIEFSLRKSPLYTSLNHIKDFLPDKPTNEIILYSIKELIDMGKSC